jgi:hypothetical protein
VSQETIPALRPVETVRIQHQGRDYLLLRDPQGMAPEPLLLPVALAGLLRFFDGRHTLRDVQLALTRSTGHIAAIAEVRSFVETRERGIPSPPPGTGRGVSRPALPARALRRRGLRGRSRRARP